MPSRLQQKIAMITGASRGLGAAVARAYAREGAHLILVARTQGGLEEIDDDVRAAGGTATLVALDLRKPNDIENMTAAIHERFGKLDILVGNAAVLRGLSPVSHFSPDDFDEVMSVNLRANWRLIRCFEPLLRQSDAGRAIFITDGIADKSSPFWGIYAASKAALESMVQSWAAELGRTTKIRVNLFDPGPMRTRLRVQAFPGEVPETLPEPDCVTEGIIALSLPEHQGNGEIIRFRNMLSH